MGIAGFKPTTSPVAADCRVSYAPVGINRRDLKMAITEVSIRRECLAKLLEDFVGRKQRWAESASIDVLIRVAHRDSGVVLCVWSEGNWIITRFGMSRPFLLVFRMA